jgi:hypothetical protein
MAQFPPPLAERVRGFRFRALRPVPSFSFSDGWLYPVRSWIHGQTQYVPWNECRWARIWNSPGNRFLQGGTATGSGQGGCRVLGFLMWIAGLLHDLA